MPSDVRALTPKRCGPGKNVRAGLVAVIAGTNLFAPAGAGIEKSQIGVVPETSYTLNCLMHFKFTLREQAGIFVKS